MCGSSDGADLNDAVVAWSNYLIRGLPTITMASVTTVTMKRNEDVKSNNKDDTNNGDYDDNGKKCIWNYRKPGSKYDIKYNEN